MQSSNLLNELSLVLRRNSMHRRRNSVGWLTYRKINKASVSQVNLKAKVSHNFMGIEEENA